jgi:hypothetical protein
MRFKPRWHRRVGPSSSGAVRTVEKVGMTGHDQDADDDWAPLTPEQQALGPGELDAPGEPVAPDGLVPEELLAPPAPPKPEPPPRNERGERMLRELAERCARSGTGTSLVAELQRREDRTRRKGRQAQIANDQLQGQFVAGDLPAPPPPPEPEFEVARASDRDPREFEPWFRELPEQEQERLRASWSEERHRYDTSGKEARARIRRAAGYGAGMFFVNSILLIFLTGDPLRFLIYVPVGAVVGAVAQLAGGTRFHFMVMGMLGFGLIEGRNLLSNPFMLYGLLLSIATMGVVGMDREMRMSAGERDT